MRPIYWMILIILLPPLCVRAQFEWNYDIDWIKQNLFGQDSSMETSSKLEEKTTVTSTTTTPTTKTTTTTTTEGKIFKYIQ